MIERVLHLLGDLGKGAELGEIPEAEHARDILRFLEGFAGKLHGHKEETYFYPRLSLHGFGPQMGLVSVMLYDHRQAQARLHEVTASLRSLTGNGSLQRFARVVRSYVLFVTGHIKREEGLLFWLASQVLNDDDERAIEEGLAKLEMAGREEDDASGLRDLADRLLLCPES